MPPLTFGRVVLDVADYERSARFWTEALGYEVTYRSDSFWILNDPARPEGCSLGLQRAEGPKPEVNALHVELFTDEMEREAARLEALGAARAKDWPYGDDEPNWIVMRDPDGHEFCVVETKPR